MKKKGIYITLVIVLAVALLGSAIYLFSYFWSSKQNEELNDQLRQDTMTTEATTTRGHHGSNHRGYHRAPGDLRSGGPGVQGLLREEPQPGFCGLAAH